jgi:cation:H+ antiporter
MGVLFALIIIVIMSLVIWKSGEGFESASDYLGRNLSDGVKGATINAIGSSLPELLTTIFFLFILKNADGFAAGLGTTAGSAVFNAAIIPFIVGVAVFVKFKKSSFEISRKVLLRDGIALILVNLLLIVMINYGTSKDGNPIFSLTWKEGGLLMVFYLLYLVFLFARMDKNEDENIDLLNARGKGKDVQSRRKRDVFASVTKFQFEKAVVGHGVINTNRAWVLLVLSMLVMSAGCYGLAEASIKLGEELDIPIFVVSVIIAAAATSVPDTFLSYKDALKGNYDDSISNAFGSNVFDIGFAVGFPVLLYGLLNLNVSEGIILEKTVLNDVIELLALLLIITISIFVIFMSSSKLSLWKMIVVFMLYLIFIFVVIAKSMKLEFMKPVSEFLLNFGHGISF